MDIMELVRMRCPTCERRLEVPTSAKFVACARCGSEYSIERHGGSITLAPYIDEVQQLNEQIVRAEQHQAGGCANLTFTAVGLAAVVFLIFGIVGLIFDKLVFGCLFGWIIGIVIIFFGFAFAGRYVNTDQIKLEQLRQERERVASTDVAAAADSLVVQPKEETT